MYHFNELYYLYNKVSAILVQKRCKNTIFGIALSAKGSAKRVQKECKKSAKTSAISASAIPPLIYRGVIALHCTKRNRSQSK